MLIYKTIHMNKIVNQRSPPQCQEYSIYSTRIKMIKFLHRSGETNCNVVNAVIVFCGRFQRDIFSFRANQNFCTGSIASPQRLLTFMIYIYKNTFAQSTNYIYKNR